MARAAKVQRIGPPETLDTVERRNGCFETEHFYTHRLSLLYRLLARETKQMLADPFRLSQMEWRILVELERSSPSKIVEINKRSLMQKPQISSALPRLVRKGYVVRTSDPADARAPFFSITDEGLALYRAVVRVSRQRQRVLESLLSERERKTFAAALNRLIRHLIDGNNEASGANGGRAMGSVNRKDRKT